MATAAEPIRSYEFGVFTVEVTGGELRKHGVRLKLQERPFQLLVCLLERPGEIVSRDELRQRLWPDGTFVDFDHNISSAINKLRTALNDSASNPRFIETVGSRGYRFLADVKRIPSDPTSASQPQKQLAPEVPIIAATTSSPRQGLWKVVAGTALLLSLIVAGYFQWVHKTPESVAPVTRVMVAVLPFQNLTGDPAQDYFSDGLTEEMIAALTRLNQEHMGIIARTSVMLYKQSPKPLDQIGRELGVQYLMEGSVRRDSSRVRITAELIQVKDQSHLWAREYDRELNNSLALQSEIAQEIGDEIQISLGDSKGVKAANHIAPTHSTASYEAYDLYLKGRYFWNKRTRPGFLQAASYFQQAIAKDPQYASAYAGLADTFGLMSTWYAAPQQEFMPKAKAAALNALALDDSLAEAHASLALVAENYDYDWQTAEKEFRRAIQLNPDYATAHQWYAEYLGWQGRFDEALAESERARQLDPMSLIIATDRGTILFYARKYDRAIDQFRAVLDMDPGFGNARAFLAATYVQQGKFAEALKENELMENGEDPPWYWAFTSYIYNHSGNVAQAQHALAKFEELSPKLRADAVLARLIAYNGSPQHEKVVLLLEQAYKEHSPALTNIKVDPRYDNLRKDQRFQQLLARMNLNN
ncbi:MAG TPA: winged helix-turn-helix domain-containing protein [Candidatus Angelobacter sp.]|jgi:TolB-like protein/DNA-binding winged helix-turn-helix (wHTH) protein/Tfp pilus assembly protein PilF